LAALAALLPVKDKPLSQIRQRELLLRDTFTPAEAILFWTILIATPVVSWAADPSSHWVLGCLPIAAGLCPVILRTHELNHPFIVARLWRRVATLSAPIWLIVLLFTVGVVFNPLVPVKIGNETLLTLKDVPLWLPASTAAQNTWLTTLALASVYLVAMNLFIVPKSRSFFERTLSWLCLNAVLIAVVGYLHKALTLQSALLTEGTGRADFFAFFPYDGHWAAFALLWSAVCIGMALLTARYDDSTNFIDSIGPWYLTGGTLLGVSGFVVQARWPAAILLCGFSVMLLIVAIHFFKHSKDANRITIALCSTFGSLATLAAGIFRALQTSESTEPANALRQSALELFQDRPLFGWGVDSFPQLLPFYADDTLLHARHERASSDALQLLAEIGLIGCLPMAILLVYLVVRYLRGRHDIRLTNHMLVGCVGVILLACVDSPFMSPAVCLSFFIVFFAALRWGDLSRTQVDKVDAKPDLIVDASKRRVPFFTTDDDQ
jgi:O-antigen ligase